MTRFRDRFLPLFVALFCAFLVGSSSDLAHAGERIGETCQALGLTTMAADQKNLIACMKDENEGLVWKSMTCGQNGVPSGTIAFFALAGCPEGWALTDGNNKTVDLRGEFLRVWDAGKGVDNARSLGSRQGDAIRNITGTAGLVHSASAASSGAFSYRMTWPTGGIEVGGSSWNVFDFDASRVVPTADENRPRNIALLACQKK